MLFQFLFFFLYRWPPNWLCWLARLLAWTVRGTGLSWSPLCCRWYAAMIDCCKNDLSSYCIMLSSRWLQNVSWQTASSLKKCVSDLIVFLQSFNLVQISFPCKLMSTYNYFCFNEGVFFFFLIGNFRIWQFKVFINQYANFTKIFRLWKVLRKALSLFLFSNSLFNL